MPVLSKFCGVAIRMLFFRECAPRFQAIYGNMELVVAVRPLRILRGNVPQRVGEMVMEWASPHQAGLVEAWNLLNAARPPKAITPLR